MTIDYTTQGECKITMYDQVDNITEEAPVIYRSGTSSATTSPSNLYSEQEPYEGNTMLSDSDREDYYTLTANYLYISKRGRQDIQTSIVIHYIWVRNPTQDD